MVSLRRPDRTNAGLVRLLVWTMFAALLAGCGTHETAPVDGQTSAPAVRRNADQLSPEETVKKLVSAYLNKRLGEYYDLVATVDKKAKSLDSLQSEFAPSSSDLVTDYLFQYTRFKIDSSSVDGDTALVYVTALSPNLRSVVKEATVVERSLGQDSDMATKMSLLHERLRISGGPSAENHSTYFLVREPQGWRAVIGWADQKAFEEQMRSADSTHSGGT